MWSDEEIAAVVDLFPESFESDALIPRPPEVPYTQSSRKKIFSKTNSSSAHNNIVDISDKRSGNSNSKIPSKKNGSLSGPGLQEYESDSQPNSTSLVDPIWESLDPCPDVRALFAEFNKSFFYSKLDCVEVRWSPRMTLCAGLCCYEGRGGLCSIRLSEPLLKLRPRSDLVETLLHEMIHAYLFVTNNDRDRESHGPNFRCHMDRINSQAGTNITVYHTFHREVENYQTHWWRCTGPCRNRPPFFGYVKRAMNRAPGRNDTWWGQHQATCDGHFVKIKEPSKPDSVKTAKSIVPKAGNGDAALGKQADRDIRKFFTPEHKQETSLSGEFSDDNLQPSTSTSSGPHVWPPADKGHILGGSCSHEQSRIIYNTPHASKQSSSVLPKEFHARPVNLITDSVSCPVCTEVVPSSSINEHLDFCLQ
ncbi:unnamed protein product [Calicophoron daubneyi]|uniref:Protein with SprT-like domain at the N terminus n=1 Tax=Calicophoron daubneyi TaxID=300641 RepID=A0AAV2TVB3_CALDB